MYLRINAIQEVVDYINTLDLPEDLHHPINIVADYIRGIKDLLDLHKHNSDLLNDEEKNQYEFLRKEVLHKGIHKHLPIPVYTYTRPTLSIQFILYILLS